MMIEKIDVSHLVIMLSAEDMEIFSLDYKIMEMSDENSRKIIKRLLNIAIKRTGCSTDNKKMIIEAFEFDGGCIFLVTLKEKKKAEKKIYRIKKEWEKVAYIFETVDDMLSCLETLYKSGYALYKSDVYIMEGKYILIISTKKYIAIAARVILSEYSKKQSNVASEISKVKEYGKIISKEYAILVIGGTLALRDM